jgi:hypothetical protein
MSTPPTTRTEPAGARFVLIACVVFAVFAALFILPAGSTGLIVIGTLFVISVLIVVAVPVRSRLRLIAPGALAALLVLGAIVNAAT